MEEFKFDTQLLLDGSDLDEDEIHDYIMEHQAAFPHQSAMAGAGVHGFPR